MTCIVSLLFLVSYSIVIIRLDIGVAIDNTTNIHLELDPLSSYGFDLPYGHDNQSDDLTIFPSPETYCLVPGYLPECASPSVNVYSGLDGINFPPASPKHINTPVLRDFNLETSRTLLNNINEERKAKRARAQILREELAQLVAEGL